MAKSGACIPEDSSEYVTPDCLKDIPNTRITAQNTPISVQSSPIYFHDMPCGAPTGALAPSVEPVFASAADLPSDLTLLTAEEVADSLRFLGLQHCQVNFLAEDIDGFLLVNLNTKALTQLGLNDLEVCKVKAFIKGWRPGRSGAQSRKASRDDAESGGVRSRKASKEDGEETVGGEADSSKASVAVTEEGSGQDREKPDKTEEPGHFTPLGRQAQAHISSPEQVGDNRTKEEVCLSCDHREDEDVSVAEVPVSHDQHQDDANSSLYGVPPPRPS